MSRRLILIILGILVAISPFVGLPLSILSWVLPILGALIVLTTLALKKRKPVTHDSTETGG